MENQTQTIRLNTLREKFEEIFGKPKGPCVAVSAPGRVNLIGEHTDYNNGFVFPVAINRTVDVLAEAVPGTQIDAYGINVNEQKSFSLSDRSTRIQHSWLEYPRGVICLLRKNFPNVTGMRLAIQGDIPQGAGLSSSAALEVATAFATRELFGLDISVKDLALLCQRAEHTYVGVKCGIMDQFASALCEEGCALLLDCQSQETRSVPLPTEQFSLVIVNSMVKRGLVDSEYNTMVCGR